MPGQGIEAHKDGPLYEPRVAVLSLGSTATLQFLPTTQEDGAGAPFDSLLLPPRGLLLFAGDEAYARRLHSIQRLTSDDLALPGLVRLDLPRTPETAAAAAAATAAAATAAAEMAGGPEGRFLPRGRRLSLTLRRVRYKWRG